MKAENLDYKNIKNILKPYTSKGRPESSSFLNWFLENVYRLDEIAADDAICDSFNDKGVDGIYVDSFSSEVHIFQSKIRQKSSSTLGDTDLKEFAGTLSQLQSPESIDLVLAGTANESLKTILRSQKIRDLLAQGYKVKGIFIANIDRDKNASDYLKINQNITLYDKKTIIDHVIDIDADAGIKGEFTLTSDVGEPLEFVAGDVAKLTIFPASALELVNLKGIQDGSLFAQNVRLGLGRTPVNREIEKSLGTASEHIKFPLYHNGITILCKSFSIKSSKVKIKDYVVVNGAQSLSTLFENKKHITTDLRLIAKIVELRGNTELARQITLNSNNQNSIKPRDLRANNAIQLRLSQEFATLNYQGIAFEIKRGENLKSAKEVISNEEAGRLLLAFDMQEPWSCHQIYRIFDELHGRVFGRPEVTAERIIVINEMMKIIISKIEKIDNKPFAHYTLTRFFILHVLSVILSEDLEAKNLLAAPKDLIKKRPHFKKFLLIIDQILAGVIVDLNYEAKQLGEAFDYKADLKSQTRVKELTDVLVTQNKKDIARGKMTTFSEAWKST